MRPILWHRMLNLHSVELLKIILKWLDFAWFVTTSLESLNPLLADVRSFDSNHYLWSPWKKESQILLVSTLFTSSLCSSHPFYLAREGVKVTDSSLDALLTASKGDMRKAVTYLQSSHQLTQGKKVITPEIVADVSGAVRISFLPSCSPLI